jgi:hypothetical protein
MASNTSVTAAVITQKLTTISVLASQFQKGINAPDSDVKNDTAVIQSDPLSSLRDAAAVFKAQITKLGLLLINKPFTPSAIFTILDDLEKRVLPANYGTASYICSRKDVYGEIFVAEITSIIQELLGTVESVAFTVKNVFKDPSKVDKDNVMLVVGKVYSVCDSIVALADKGVPGLLFRKIKEWVALMEDALAELKDWSEDIDENACEDGDSGDDDIESEDEQKHSLEEMVAGLSLNEPKQLPGFRTDLVNLVGESLGRLDLIMKLCQATSKRRVRKFPFQSPPFPSQQVEEQKVKEMITLNGIVVVVAQLQSDIDELAGAFYEHNMKVARDYLEKLSKDATAMADQTSKTWDGGEDDFTKWTETWKKLINKNALPSETPAG